MQRVHQNLVPPVSIIVADPNMRRPQDGPLDFRAKRECEVLIQVSPPHDAIPADRAAHHLVLTCIRPLFAGEELIHAVIIDIPQGPELEPSVSPASRHLGKLLRHGNLSDPLPQRSVEREGLTCQHNAGGVPIERHSTYPQQIR